MVQWPVRTLLRESQGKTESRRGWSPLATRVAKFDAVVFFLPAGTGDKDYPVR
jgi:hypothetical protein